MAPPEATSANQIDNTMNQFEHSSMAAIETLPAELLNDVMGHLRPHDLAHLARVAKKYREFAQSALWRNIELHRQDAHHDCFGISKQKDVPRAYLDGSLQEPWSYRHHDGLDPDFERRNAKFATAVRNLYKTAGKSQAWSRLAPFVRHLCLTVTHKSPPHVWNMILSLRNLITIEVIGEWSADKRGPPAATTLREPSANKVQNVRLRGYVPAAFATAICKASATSIVSLDLGILEPPQVYSGDADEEEFREHPIYVAPRGVLWYQDSWLQLTSLTNLLLCKRGPFDGPPDMSEEEDFEVREDEVHERKEFEQWASLLRSIRSTVVEVVLEQRPVYLDYLLNMEMGISPHNKTQFIRGFNSFDSQFYNRILKGVLDDGGLWPKLLHLTIRGINLKGFEEEAGEPLDAFTTRVLPGVEVEQVCGNYIFFNTRKGTIMNQHGADGLKPHLAFDSFEDYDYETMGGLFF